MLDRIQARASKLNMRRALAWTVAAPPLAVGYVIGTIVKIGKLAWAAFMEGFDAGAKL
jgi:hypothetical protein